MRASDYQKLWESIIVDNNFKCLEYRPVRNRYRILCFRSSSRTNDTLESRDIISVPVCGWAVAGEAAPGPSSGHVQASSAQRLQEYLGSQWHWWVGVGDLLQCSVVTWGGSVSLALGELRLTVSASVEGILSRAVCVVWGLDQRYLHRSVLPLDRRYA